MEWMFLPLKRYADFSGRSRRTEYWMFWLFQVIVTVILGMLFLVAGLTSGGETPGGEPEFGAVGIVAISLIVLFVLAMLVPNIAVTVRRFHDQDKSGWMYLLALIPYVGGLIIFVFMVLPGTNGPNQYGADPKLAQSVDDIFS